MTIESSEDVSPHDFSGRSIPPPITNARLRLRRRNPLLLREVIPFWFAISSPLIGLILAFLGAWLVAWTTS